MNLSGNTILITGGSEGIGFELARQLTPYNQVIICGRSERKLQTARERLPDVITESIDLTRLADIPGWAESLVQRYPALNVLINNAGGRNTVDLKQPDNIVEAMEWDLSLNFRAPVTLTSALLPHFTRQSRATIVNVTTGLVYLPKARLAFYCAAKSALHSYTKSLAWEMKNTAVSVYEALMPLVDTAFHQGQLPTTLNAMSPERAARDLLEGLGGKPREFGIGKARLAASVAHWLPARGQAMMNR